MLASAQQQIERHFTKLAAARKPLGYPVYAIEHGLAPDLIPSLARAASTDLQRFGVRDEFWLVWVVLAAEAGYQYAGEEFWPELEIVPLEWRNNQDRKWLRRRFRRFTERFGGPVPVGRWAKQFSIIAWPIANSILPRYLQAHFAEHLFANRYSLADLSSESVDRLGTYLSDVYRGSSSRFSEFLQQTSLTATIVLALKEEEVPGSTPRVIPDVLRRIVEDLEKRRDSKDYLRAARGVISKRRASVSASLGRQERNETAATSSDHAIAGARLIARRPGKNSLLVGVVFPDAGSALQRASLTAADLAPARIRLVGTESRPEPALNLLTYARRDRGLSSFPKIGEPVATVEAANTKLCDVLGPLLCLRERHCWVLRRHADGLYREVLGGQVRPGQAYVVVCRTAWSTAAAEAAGMMPLAVHMSDVVAYALDLGDKLSEAQRLALVDLKIGTVTGSRVEPLGLAPSYQTSDRPTWLASETVTLRVVADFDVAGFSVRLDERPPEVLPAEGGELLLVLDPLPLGIHRLRIQAVEQANEFGSGVGETAEYEFAIAGPRPWPDAMREKAGFRLSLEPIGAGLEQLFSQRARLRLLGPIGRSVRWSLETFDASGQLVSTGTGSDTAIGADPASVVAVLDRLRRESSDAIDVAHRVDVIGSVGELGRQSISFPHKVDPLRWRYDSILRRVRLVDEGVHKQTPKVRAYELPRPAAEQVVRYSDAVTGIEVKSPGMLFVAVSEGRIYSMFISAPEKERLNDLSELGVRQSLEIEQPDRDALLALISSLRRWNKARPVGPQALVRKLTTIDRIESEIGIRVCGRDFITILRENNESAFLRAQKIVGGSPGFGAKMRTFPTTEATEDHKAIFINGAKLYAVETNEEFGREAYEFAFTPTEMRFGTPNDARQCFDRILSNRTLLRGAFLARAAARRAELDAQLEAC